MLSDIRTAFSFLTILPFGASGWHKPGRSFAWFPLVGLCIGLVLAALAGASPFDRDVTAFIVLVAWVVITGGLHLDGFGDCCDGLLASATPEERRRIMKDPRAGVWAVAGLILLLLGKWLAIRAIAPDLLFLPPLLGRWSMVLAARQFPGVGEAGLGAAFRIGLGWPQVVIATATTLALALQADALFLIPLIFAFALAFGRWAAGRLDGDINGDVYGAVCELSELLCLLALGAING